MVATAKKKATRGKQGPRNGNGRLKLEYVPLAKLKPFKGNPRKNQDAVGEVVRSIEHYGYTNPILVRRANNEVIAGHTRLLALKEKGIDKAPVIYLDMTAKQAHAYGIFDNRSTETTEWDVPKLTDLVEQLTASGVDLENMGFTEEDLAEMQPPTTLEPAPADDVVPDRPKKAKTKPGDLYLLGEHRLLCGDATKAEDVQRVMGGEKPFIMVTDPPYGVEYNPQWRQDAAKAGHLSKARRAVGQVTNDNRDSWKAAYELSQAVVVYVWHASASASAVQFAVDLMECKYEIRNQIIWKKPTFAIGRGAYHWQHEPCWYAVRKGCKSKWCGDRSQSTVWDISNRIVDHTDHGTQKPVECMARPIRNHGDEGDVVYDPFLGSGTTLIAAEKLNRKCYGLEIDPIYCDVIVKRWEDFTGKKAKRQRGAG
jgi:DNA modification methylase